MLDTNLCIRILRNRPRELQARFNAEADALCISTVVLIELLHGAGKSAKPFENRRQVEQFADRLAVLAFDAEASAHSADIKTMLGQRGQTIGAYDLLIAGHARSRGLMLITGNLGEFRRVDGLRCEDWLTEVG